MGWDRHKLLWDGTDKCVPWTNPAIRAVEPELKFQAPYLAPLSERFGHRLHNRRHQSHRHGWAFGGLAPQPNLQAPQVEL